MIKEDFQKIQSCGKYNPILNKAFLVSCFLNESLVKPLWEYNFYSLDNNTTYTFIIDNDDAILKDSGSLMNLKKNPEPLSLVNIKLNEKEAIALAKYHLVKKYNEENISKIIISIDHEKTILWNITVVLKNLNIINLRINDKNSEVMDSKLVSPFNFIK